MANTKTKKETTPTNEDTVENKPVVPIDVDPHQIIIVKNGFNGKLVYISPRTHETYKWDGFGDEQEMELRELRNAKSASKKFFINNWFMFDEENMWVIDYLGLNQYYKKALSLDDFESVFDKSPAQIEEIINGLSSGQKSSLTYKARQMIADGEIDSRKVINVLEKALGVELIER